MNKVLLQKYGINKTNPKEVLKELRELEIRLLSKREDMENIGQSAIAEKTKEEIYEVRKEIEQVKEEAKAYVEPQPSVNEEVQKDASQGEGEEDKPEGIVEPEETEEWEEDGEPEETQAEEDIPVPEQTREDNAIAAAVVADEKVVPMKMEEEPEVHSDEESRVPAGFRGFSEGLLHYHFYNYEDAWKCFYHAVEKCPSSDLDQKSRALACYYLALMAINGWGMKRNNDLGIHYLDMSAGLGNKDAQLLFGSTLVMVKGYEKDFKKGLGYLEEVAGMEVNDSEKHEKMKKNATEEYVNAVLSMEKTDKKLRKKAKRYIEECKKYFDSFETEKFDALSAELNKREKGTSKKRFVISVYLLGQLLILLGVVYLFKGVEAKAYVDGSEGFLGMLIADVPDFVILKWDSLTDVTKEFMSNQGVFGCWLLLLGSMGAGLGQKERKLSRGIKSLSELNAFLIVVLNVIYFSYVFYQANAEIDIDVYSFLVGFFLELVINLIGEKIGRIIEKHI